MNHNAPGLRQAPHPYETYEEILDRDSHPVPRILREYPGPDVGTEPVAASRYTDPAFFAKEASHVWMKAWQFACLEAEIAEPGDYQIYEIVGRSLIVTRTPSGAIKAFHNSCLHRGRKLVTLDGCKQAFRCPFHGITWNTDGTLKENPIGWDFPQWDGQDMSLPEAKVATWEGFVFVNFDLAAPPLETVIQPLPEHFNRWRYGECYKAVHVQKVMAANWKVVAEAFMESHHAIVTHPQLLPYICDINSQYDLLSDHVSRQFSAQGHPSPFVADRNVTQQQVIDSFAPVIGAKGMQLEDGKTARESMAEHLRQAIGGANGNDYGEASDAEMLDALLYNVFPNFSVWGGFAINFVYRWRPNGTDVDSSIMDVMVMQRGPADGPKPKPCPVHHLAVTDTWSMAPELGGLIGIFEQDEGNLHYVQEGLKTSATGLVHFGKYSEMRIRHQHHMLDRYINKA
jgi:nitrite reductase/ring-hydroxylating ferredoxin subunit